MALEIEGFLELAHSRNELVLALLKENKVYMPAEEVKTQRTMTIAKAVVSKLDIVGRNNLEEAWELVKDGKKLAITSNHQSDADHDIKIFILEALGFREFADRIFFIGGLRMLERPETAYFMPSENVLMVATPMDLDNMQEASGWINNDSLTEAQEKTLFDYIDNMDALSTQSRAIYERLRNSGMVPAFYPEATRSRDEKGRLGRAPGEIIRLLPNEPDSFVCPWVIDGTADIMTIKDVLKLKRTGLRSAVGRSYPIEEIYTTNREGVTLNGSKATYADVVMARLAVLMPELVKPEELDFYRQLLGGYQPELDKGPEYHASFPPVDLSTLTKMPSRERIFLPDKVDSSPS